MSAHDAFEWLVSGFLKNPDQELRQYIEEQRRHLLALRSEDEKQRFVENLLQELRSRLVP